jgi:hypothetical protein
MNRKRKYRKLADDELLEAILADRFAIDGKGNVYSINGHARQLTVFDDHQGRPMIRLYYDRGRRQTTVGRIVWMIANRRAVPEGYAVDHINRDKHDNRPENLRLLEFGENSRQNQHWQEEF